VSLFQIKDALFEIEQAAVVGILNKDGSFAWAMDVETKRIQSPLLGVAGPKISITTIPHPKGVNRDLSRVEWRNVRAYYDDNWHGDFYVYDAEEYYECEISLARASWNFYALKWSGLCDVNWNEEYGKRVPFKIETTAAFNGILCNIDNEEKARDALANRCNDHMFAWIELQSGEHIFFPREIF